MSETVKLWIDEFKQSNRSLVDEIEEIKQTIKNEELWMKGSYGEDEQAHKQNIVELKEYLEWLEGR